MPLSEEELNAYILKSAQEDLEWCEKAALMFPFRAGDHVKHVGTGEQWVLACDQEENDVMPAGWPETLAKATHCRLVKAATDEERFQMLCDVADGKGGMRALRAARQLVGLGALDGTT